MHDSHVFRAEADSHHYRILLRCKQKKPPVKAAFSNFRSKSTRVEFDDQLRFHDNSVRNIRQSWYTNEGRNHLVVINFDVIGNVTFCELRSFQNDGQLLGLLTHFNNVASLATVRTDVDLDAIDRNVAVVDELTGSKHSRHELGAVDDGVQTRFQQADQVFGSIALATVGFVVGRAELLFTQVAVVALQLLLTRSCTPKSESLPLRR